MCLTGEVPCDLSIFGRTLKRYSETNSVADRKRSERPRKQRYVRMGIEQDFTFKQKAYITIHFDFDIESERKTTDDDAMLFDVIIGLNVLIQGETIINENGVIIRNKPKCTEEVATLSVLPINLSPDDIEINIASDIP
ncbi:hypothetical protein TNCV_4319511 [Trichonephila clavipes]|nr:hypothetical protein TNCV_4319511 [Trichonephila clavipes]